MIYLDNAATTRMYEECADTVDKYNRELYFNPSARYRLALKAEEAIKEARSAIAEVSNVNTPADDWLKFSRRWNGP